MSDTLTICGESDEHLMKELGNNARVLFNVGYRKKRSGKRFQPEPDGLYDPRIFGTMDQSCGCGIQRTSGRCPSCKQIVVRNRSDWVEYIGYYILCIPFLTEVKVDKFIHAVSKYLGVNIGRGNILHGLDLYSSIWCWEFSLKKVSENDRNAYLKDEDNNYYAVEINDSTDTSDFMNCGLFAIYSIAKTYESTKGNIKEILEYVNQCLPIAPVALREMRVDPTTGDPTYPSMTSDYALIIEMDATIDYMIKNNVAGVKLADKLALAATISKEINNIFANYPLLKRSKESWIRYANTGRVPHSGRCNIISADTDFNVVQIPPSLAYESIKDDIIDKLSEICYESNEDPVQLYKNLDPRAIQVMEDIMENSVVVINRAPTLHRWNMLAFKAQLWKEKTNYDPDGGTIATMGLNTIVCGAFNADFDGDTMSFYIFTKSPDKEAIYDKMGVEHNWFYEKNAEPVFVPKDTVLLGLNAATKYVEPEEGKIVDSMNGFEMLENNYINEYIQYDEVVDLVTVDQNGLVSTERTTYGIKKIETILHHPLNVVLGVNSKDKTKLRITSKNIAKLVAYIDSFDDKVDMMNQLFKLGNEIAERHGTQLFKLEEVYKMDPKFPEIEKIINDPEMPEKQKFIELNKNMDDYVKANIRLLMPTLYGEMQEGGVSVKGSSLTSSFMPQVKFEDGKVSISYQSLGTGLGSEEMIHHTATNREILHQKAELVPAGGYLTRQVVDLERNYIYKANEPSQDKIGINVKKKDAVGRYRLDGSAVGEPMNDADGETLVRIMSCIHTPNNGVQKFYVRKYEINEKLYKTENNSAIGMSVAMSTTESITQAALGLKHGGNLLSPTTEALKVTKPFVVKELGDDYCILASGVDEFWYPVPPNHVYTKDAIKSCNDKTPIKMTNYHGKNEAIIYYLDELHYVDYSVKQAISILGANPQSDYNPLSAKYEGTECYVLRDGKIHYDLANKHNRVVIGNHSIPYDSRLVYYYPEGYELKRGTKFCSGTLSPRIINKMTSGSRYTYEDKFDLFYWQMKDFIPSIQLLSIELLFRSLFKFGTGTIASSIKQMDPIITMGHERALSTIKRIINTPLLNTLGLGLIFNKDNRNNL